MHRRFIVCLVGLCSIFILGCSRNGNSTARARHEALTQLEPDEILISIDGNALTYGQAVQQVKNRLGGPPPQGMDPERIASIERRAFNAVVDDFIRRELLLAEARRLGIEPEQEHIEQALSEIEKTATDDKAPTSLYYEGPDALRREVTAGLTIEKLLAQQLPPFQHPSDEEITANLEKHPSFSIMPARANVRHIFLATPPQTDDERIAQLRANLEDAREQLLKGADFAQTANIISQDASASRGGHLGILVKGRGDPSFEEAVFTQPIGEIGPIVQSAEGLHIIQVLDRIEERPATQEEIIAQMRRQHRATELNNYVRELMQRIEIRHSPAIQPLPAGP